jgi:S1-C subfamily serine protease
LNLREANPAPGTRAGGFGKGIFLSQDGEFLTALHLLEQSPHATSVFIQLYDGAFYVNHPVEAVISFSRTLGVAIVRVQLGGVVIKVPPIGPLVRIGDQVSGFRSGVFELLCTTGQVSALSPSKITVKGTNFLLPGSSGAPIFNGAGQVIAIAVEMIKLDPGWQHSDYLYTGVPIGKALSMRKLPSPLPLQDFLATIRR